MRRCQHAGGSRACPLALTSALVETAVRVLFGTDRRKLLSRHADGSASWGFDGGRGEALTLGAATVSIPRQHKRGQIELPAEYGLLGVTLYREAADPSRHFVLAGMELLSRDAFLKMARGLAGRRTAMIFIHGFNTSFEAGPFRTAQLFYDLQFPGTPYFYSWPSRGGVGDVTLYASSNDRAMPASRLAGIAQAGDVPSGGPIVVRGVDTIDASAARTDLLALNHSGYAESPELLADIGILLVCGIRPPTKRFLAFDEVATAAGSYWRLRPVPGGRVAGHPCRTP